jgi:hypothetical protein
LQNLEHAQARLHHCAMLPVHTQGPVDPALAARLEDELAVLETLSEALRWVRSHGKAAAIESVLTQDEFTHDILVRLEGGAYVAFDTT